MWYRMANEQRMYDLSERLIRSINCWQSFGSTDDDDVEQLIERGADVNRQHGTLLPLHCACMVSDSYILRLLISKGARVNDYDGYERAAMHYAAERDVFCVEMLLEHGADINIGDGNSDTPLHWATFKDNVQCVKLLLQRGAKVDPLDYNNDTPLSWAARKGHFEIINILLQYNADSSIENLRGLTPLDKCVQVQMSGLNTENDNKSLELLLRASSKLDLTEEQRVTVKGDNRLTELFSPRVEMPCSLQGQCRYRIRKSMGCRYLPNVIPKLPIPQRVQDYIALKC
ncbi:ankyrin repeat and SOCS box protein 8-like [Mya arenaria]|uniref:ankyrin repeat and SOCS box protein 8-like n=1 Tax=Mya arenaria TaxID=6604 RepID=UPI0022DEF005|nr:ankyrin repeat and SOCS box protein 8-like [Mya arenaria]XP_052812291.1 ankyrin repeat and SOCS box protein 8-like [Mya arenaria]XP_052812292.1 ankyrin repeat and SOCS box protein 8-like [Mya arenaria]